MNRRILCILLATAALASTTAPASAQAGLGSKAEQLLYVALRTRDIARARRFYTAVIGLKEMPGGNAAKSVMLSFSGGYGESFVLVSQDAAAAPPTKGGPLQRLAFKVQDTRAVVERARTMGATVKTKPASAHGIKGLTVGTILDPDGNEIELVQSPAG